jgi:hypothetical protein
MSRKRDSTVLYMSSSDPSGLSLPKNSMLLLPAHIHLQQQHGHMMSCAMRCAGVHRHQLVRLCNAAGTMGPMSNALALSVVL